MGETLMCGYTGYEFGAGYPDSVCIDGYLWDADSCDEPGGGFTHGGEWACPRCNTTEFLKDALTNAQEPSCGESMRRPHVSATQWERSIELGMRESPQETVIFMAKVEPFVTIDWPDRQAVLDGRAPWDLTVERQWPWRIEAAIRSLQPALDQPKDAP